jgi:hypothetical protein
MLESIQQYLEAPIPTWMFAVAVVILWFRDSAISSTVQVIVEILEKHSLTLE